MAITSFRDLRVWRVSMDLVAEVYKLTQVLPKEEVHGLTLQMRRAAVSIASNIAEGHTREHSKEYLQHLSVAQGSLAELETQLEIAARLGYLPPERMSEVLGHAGSLGRQLYALRNALVRGRDGGAAPRPLTPDPRPPSEAEVRGRDGGAAP
ncbi:MAG: four helix bundle protein, partial [Chloroflexi bacterium]|nr:four helix bundle protein [Chloroflexota bacterium]